MRIVIDTREQRPLIFPCDSIRKKLHVGDYGAEFGGVLHPLAFERKSIGDLFGTLTFGYDRFRREMLKAADLGVKLVIVVEASKERVLKGYHHSARDPESIIVQLETIRKKYNVETIFFPSRKAMANYILDWVTLEYERRSDK